MRGLQLVVLFGCAGGCGDNRARDVPFFVWDPDQHTVGAMALDKLPPEHPGMRQQIDTGPAAGWVVMFYAHVPGETIGFDTIEAALARARELDMPTLTYADLAAG